MHSPFFVKKGNRGAHARADTLVKESISAGSRIYTVELQEIKKPSDTGGRPERTNDGKHYHSDGRRKVAEEAAKINRVRRFL